MKNIILCMLLAAGSIAGAAAQSTHNLDRLKVSPIKFANSYFELSYELMLGQNKSLTISPMVMLKKNNFEEFKGFQAELQYRVYLKTLSRPEDKTWIFSDIGLYTGIYANGITYSEDIQRYVFDPVNMEELNERFSKDVTGGETGVFVGLQLVASQKVALDLTVGGGVRYTEVDDEFEQQFPDLYYDSYDVFDIEYFGVKPKINLQLGIVL